MARITAPPLDPELVPAFDAMLSEWPSLGMDSISEVRRWLPPATDEQLDGRGVERREMKIPGFRGAEISVTVFRRIGDEATGPGFFHIHGGGMILDDSSTSAPLLADLLELHGGTGISVGYRLAPEFPDPYPVEDCYSGLVWAAEHASELGFDPSRVLLIGESAGGGLAAGTALLSRDRQGPALVGLLLMCPMLDDRDASASTLQFDGTGGWDRGANNVGWSALLGDRKGGENVSIYAAPARAEDLSHLPSVFIECGSAEIFRDENVDFASRIWAVGGQAELHVWAGGFHGYQFVNEFALSRATVAARMSWVARILSP